MSLHEQSITELGRALRKGELSPVELAGDLLARIETFDGKLGAFKLVCADRALDQARAAEKALRAGDDRGPLHGVPYVAKDLFDVGGLPTGAGTRLFENNVARESSAAVTRLEEAGAVLLGKTHTVQFAYGGVGINNDQGTPHNPWHEKPHLPGGSSSGTGVAVAARLAPGGLGTDTGGSVRIPAAMCGVSGLKTTVGRISRHGVYPLSGTLDSVGPLARTIEDLAILYDCLEGEDPRDDTTRGRPDGDVMSDLGRGVRGTRVCFAESAFWDDVDNEIVAAVRATGAVFEELGARVDSADFPEARAAVDLNPGAGIIASEAYANNRKLVDERFDELDFIVATRMAAAREISAADYLETMRELRRLQSRMPRAFGEAEVLLCPTTTIPAVPLETLQQGQEEYARLNVQCLRNTSVGNLLGLCGLSVPCGFTRGGLPIGLMIYGKPFDEATVLRVGHAFQQATDWHRRAPDLGWTGA